MSELNGNRGQWQYMHDSKEAYHMLLGKVYGTMAKDPLRDDLLKVYSGKSFGDTAEALEKLKHRRIASCSGSP